MSSPALSEATALVFREPPEWAKRGYGFVYLALVGASVLLPSAKIYEFNVKITLTAVLLVFAAWCWRILLSDGCDSGTTRSYHQRLMFLAVIIAAWSVVALTNQFNPLPEVRSMLAPLVMLAAYHPRLVPRMKLLRVYAGGAIAYAMLKVGMLLAVYGGILDVLDLVRWAWDIFKIELVTGPTCERTLYKAIIVNDLTLVVFPLLLLESRFRRPLVYFGIGLAALAILFSYSRYLIFSFSVIAALSMWLSRSASARLGAGVALASVILTVSFIVGNCFFTRVTFETGDPNSPGVSANRYADDIRTVQFARFKELIRTSPIIGLGVGSYHREYIRVPLLPYSYEMQLLSFVFKFGFLGFALIFATVISLLWVLFGTNWAAWANAAVLGAGGLTNPFYESSAFGIALVLAIVLFSRWAAEPRAGIPPVERA
jgi:hypothetical protein